MDADVIIVGAGPTGLMVAGELRRAGVRSPKANALGGPILQLLRHRVLLERSKAAGTDPSPAPRFPFSGVPLDFTHLADPPLHARGLPHARLEQSRGEWARSAQLRSPGAIHSKAA